VDDHLIPPPKLRHRKPLYLSRFVISAHHLERKTTYGAGLDEGLTHFFVSCHPSLTFRPSFITQPKAAINKQRDGNASTKANVFTLSAPAKPIPVSLS
jgi:hypothetical protein